MIEWCCDPREGQYFKVSDKSLTDFETTISRKDVRVGDRMIHVGDETTFLDYYDRPVKFIGYRATKGMGKQLVFYLGSEGGDLFNPDEIHYFQELVLLSPTRFFLMFSAQAGRDFNLKNGKWR